MNYLGGIKIVESPVIPERMSVYKLHPDTPMTDAFRAEMQAWCDEFFGTTPCFIVVQGGPVYTHPKNAARLRAAVLAERTEP